MTNVTSHEYALAEGLNLYLAPILIIVGTICNILVILVMRAPFFVHVSTSLYMFLNAVVDTASLAVVLPFHWLHLNFPDVLTRQKSTDILCNVLHFTGWSTSDMGIALTVAMTFERAFAVKVPLKAASFCTRRRARHIVIVICFLIFAKDGQFLFKSKMVEQNVTSYLCELTGDDPAFHRYAEKIWPILHNVFVFVSFGIIIGSNVIIIKNVQETTAFQGTTFKNKHRGRSSVRRCSTSRSRQLTIMLISDSLTIIICTLPFALHDAIRPHIYIKDVGLDHLLYTLSFYLLYINRCANFFLYAVSGERFRLSLKQICVRRQFRNTSNHSTGQSYRHAADNGASELQNNTTTIRTIS